MILSNIRVLVLPDQVAVPKVKELLAADGGLSDAATTDRLRSLGATLARTLQKLAA